MVWALASFVLCGCGAQNPVSLSSSTHETSPGGGIKSKIGMKVYRFTSQEASQLEAERVVEKIVWRIMEDAPDQGDSKEMERFLNGLSAPQAAAYAAWETSNWVVVGGAGHMFEICSAPLIYKAVEAFELLHEPRLADSLRQLCQRFPGGKVPDDCEAASAFIESMSEDATVSKLLGEFEKRPVKDWFDVERFFQAHRDSFVIPDPGQTR